MDLLHLFLGAVCVLSGIGSLVSTLSLLGVSAAASLCTLRALLSGCTEAAANAAGLSAAAVVMIGFGGFSACARTTAFFLAAALAILHAWLATPSPLAWAAAAQHVHDQPHIRSLVRSGLLPQCSVDGARDGLLLLSALRSVASTWAWLYAGLATIRAAVQAHHAQIVARPEEAMIEG
jgi:hypothetical protein